MSILKTGLVAGLVAVSMIAAPAAFAGHGHKGHGHGYGHKVHSHGYGYGYGHKSYGHSYGYKSYGHSYGYHKVIYKPCYQYGWVVNAYGYKKWVCVSNW